MIKRTLCRYFSEDDGKTVTVGSLFDNTMDYLTREESIWVYIAILLLSYGSFLLGVFAIGKNNDSMGTMDAWDIIYTAIYGLVIIILCVLSVHLLYKIYKLSHKIKITECQRKE